MEIWRVVHIKRQPSYVLWRTEFLRDTHHSSFCVTPDTPVHFISVCVCVVVYKELLIMVVNHSKCLLQLLFVDVVTCSDHTDLVLFLLVQDAQKVLQLGDGESVPL